MLRRVIWMLTVSTSLIAMPQADDKPFVGKWKLNISKSKLTGQSESVESVGPNRYQFRYGELTWTLVADGTKQPFPFGGTATLIAVVANTWKFTYAINGMATSTEHWWLAPDGKSMLRAIEGIRWDGSACNNETRYTRTSSEKGFAGTWKSRKITAITSNDLIIVANGDDGITRTIPAEDITVSLKFDGTDYAVKGPRVPAGMTLAAERSGHHKIRTTTKLNGTLLNTGDLSVSSDGKRTTVVQYDSGVTVPFVMVYDRQ